MLSERALDVAKARQSSSFAVDLGKWLAIMEAYENGGHAYHATMPTDALRGFRDAMAETKALGFDAMKEAQWDQGKKVRAALAARGHWSAAIGNERSRGTPASSKRDSAR